MASLPAQDVLHAALRAHYIEVGRNCRISLGHCPDPCVASYLNSLRQFHSTKVSTQSGECSRLLFADRLLQLPIWWMAQHVMQSSSQPTRSQKSDSETWGSYGGTYKICKIGCGEAGKLSFLQQCVVPEPPQGDEEARRILPTSALPFSSMLHGMLVFAVQGSVICGSMSLSVHWAGMGRGRAHKVHAAEEGATSTRGKPLNEWG